MQKICFFWLCQTGRIFFGQLLKEDSPWYLNTKNSLKWSFRNTDSNLESQFCSVFTYFWGPTSRKMLQKAKIGHIHGKSFQYKKKNRSEYGSYILTPSELMKPKRRMKFALGLCIFFSDFLFSACEYFAWRAIIKEIS